MKSTAKVVEFMEPFLKECSKKKKIDVSKLDIGTKIFVETQNAMYSMVLKSKVDGLLLMSLKGSSTDERVNAFLKDEKDWYFTGSTAAVNSMSIMLHCIIHNMSLEFHHESYTLKTDYVKNVTIFGKDYSYKLEW